MTEKQHITDSFDRVHDYLRISLTERCNLRCFYCMPEEGIELSEKSHVLSHEEVIYLAKEFVALGVNKIRLTGGEPLVKKNVEKIIRELADLPIQLSITTNGILLDKYLPLLKECGVKKLNISLDTLDREKFNYLTRRDYFDRVMANIYQSLLHGFEVKINAVLMTGVNESEVVDFIEFTRNNPVSFRFIEFMPFDGNQWDTSKVVTFDHIFDQIGRHYQQDQVIKLEDKKHDTTKNYKIKGYQGSFGIISTVTNPFCDSCNRIRLTANGRIKNCLFSQTETDLLTPLRAGEDVKPIILQSVNHKAKARGGMEHNEDFYNKEINTKNRAMISIGG
ncbi:MAG: GTP 3',8-cyclase MoaA [Flavobacteriales bacterium]|nr:GTP 3',8-cyclase MoaA [Flavobacteriales bacterium]